MKRVACLLMLLFTAVSVRADEPKRRPLEIDDLFRLQRLADPQISPDGQWVVYVAGKVDMKANKVIGNLWLASTDPKGPPPRQLTASAKSDRHPRWRPDGKYILFETTRSGANQLWVIDPTGGEAKPLTGVATGAASALWSRDGKQIAFVSAVWPEYSDKPFKESNDLNKKRMEENEKSPIKARVFTKLFYRHWDEYVEDKRQHLFVMDVVDKAQGLEPVGEPRDVTPGDRDAYPTSTTFSSGDDFTFSPDGKHLYFTAVPVKDEAWSTNYDLCRVPITGGKVENLTEKNLAADGAPQFSPDGKWLVWRSQKKPGFEADRWDLYALSTDPKAKAKPRNLTYDFEGSVDSFVWLPDSETLYFAAEDRGRTFYFATTVNNADGLGRLTFISHHTSGALSVSRDGKRMAFTRAAMHHPNEIMVATDEATEWKTREVSQANKKVLEELDLHEPDSVNVLGAGGTPVQMWILKPPGFDAKKKWPVAFLVHGGPQGAWDDGWSARWNAQAWAAQGYVVALPNPRGSTGFGQQFVNDISGDWGGKCYEDLMACVAYLEKLHYIDRERMGAAGASFGGYMMNWFAVNTPKFKTLITHCGVWNFDSMYATTEELWFDEWEHGGPPWGKNRNSYEKHSPHRLAANLGKYKTPMLIIHNDLDFRVPVSEGHQLFTTLQRQGVPSRFLNFPDEGHWVLKPRNSQFWHREVFSWLKKYVPPGGR